VGALALLGRNPCSRDSHSSTLSTASVKKHDGDASRPTSFTHRVWRCLHVATQLSQCVGRDWLALRREQAVKAWAIATARGAGLCCLRSRERHLDASRQAVSSRRSRSAGRTEHLKIEPRPSQSTSRISRRRTAAPARGKRGWSPWRGISAPVGLDRLAPHGGRALRASSNVGAFSSRQRTRSIKASSRRWSSTIFRSANGRPNASW
jgi:hypothetical protein